MIIIRAIGLITLSQPVYDKYKKADEKDYQHMLLRTRMKRVYPEYNVLFVNENIEADFASEVARLARIPNHEQTTLPFPYDHDVDPDCVVIMSNN